MVPPPLPFHETDEETDNGSPRGECVGVAVGKMGNRESSESEKGRTSTDVPLITVIGASPLPAEGSMFSLPGPAHAQTPRQVRRSMVLRNSVYLSGQNEDSQSEGDSASLVSYEDRSPVTLDPLEHQWMMCASDGDWDSLHHLLAAEPSLALTKDFVTGFTCLHWAAKRGKPELIALIINFAKQNSLPINVNVRSSNGYTPLHVAAMHDHAEVLKLLVSAYNADVEVRDYSGRKACQYVTGSISADLRDIICAHEPSDAQNTHSGDAERWRFSKVMQSNLKPLRVQHGEGVTLDGGARPRQKAVRTKSSLSGMRPRLQRIRRRTSQILHRTSVQETQDQEDPQSRSKSRPKSRLFRRK
ncbi:hypothetical protein LDENG_00007250 [Lucifuga dentata]|nr:hypothetical protein LDENG_00007250 [Lucifuga dentata]